MKYPIEFLPVGGRIQYLRWKSAPVDFNVAETFQRIDKIKELRRVVERYRGRDVAILVKYQRDIATHLDRQRVGHIRIREIIGIGVRLKLLLEIAPEPSRPVVVVGATSHKPDVASPEVGAVVVPIAYALHESHSSLVVHGFHRLHCRV